MNKCYRSGVEYMYGCDGLGRADRARDGVSAKSMGVTEGWGWGLGVEGSFEGCAVDRLVSQFKATGQEGACKPVDMVDKACEVGRVCRRLSGEAKAKGLLVSGS